MSALTIDSVLSLTQKVAQARVDAVPCRGSDSDVWFADEQAKIDAAQRLCAQCPLRAECLEGALARREPWGVWGGELFQSGRLVAQRKPKGRPRKDAKRIEQIAQQRQAQRLATLR
ncbi:MAG: WhiB family transcriptional regulator [Actinomycetes bacterium]